MKRILLVIVALAAAMLLCLPASADHNGRSARMNALIAVQNPRTQKGALPEEKSRLRKGSDAFILIGI